ncbi:ester cyclase [Pseudonocardia endophytica]|uniref:Steroid delta-isomerase-like uncharacterized protein n=1 Tax=Pseudonocardia endophytica TaxID=401976 RepID=A0A4R1HXV2_PSEEN|nr:nuclear transport factor 2 family protein [Pseudonocardia endophytica]TCK26353.1 steroid delta-isomerase-like uncharacterized protein [Pseudonocardia endophytica]
MAVTARSALEAYPQRYFDAWNQRDPSIALEVIHPKVHWTDPLLPEPLTDHEGAGGFFGGAWTGFPDIRFEAVGAPLVDEQHARVACAWMMTGTHLGEFPAGVPASNASFSIPGADVWEVDSEGRAVSVHAFYDSIALLRAIGIA